ncbi:glucohydrolase [Salinivibrio sp. IB868]|uniref:glycoside hydrolase family 13 protein n=1 Tax=unclassified Salinivibrio TaxID=2636825 RepID=UPI0009879F00|nr:MULTISPECIES: alpha-glucosidase [unclassified Salinivibrio]OOE65519.1 glucohydrolase [Salinivibrio sp. IB868]OOE72343.1 glucohydrolase [Salinivibrio sp. IB870]
MQNAWWHDAVVYQIYPRSFYDTNGDGIGDLNGIIEKLDYLHWLGVNVLWLSPVYQSPMDDNGYDISDYCAIAPEFGTMEDMTRLIDKAGALGIKIVMDLVVNHTSDEHPWFQAALHDKNSPYRDFYIWRDAKPDGSAPDDQGSIFGGSAWQWEPNTEQYYFHLFSKRQPDLNWENPAVHDAVYKMMNWWIDKGIGGFRLDVIDLIGKEIDKGITGNGPRLHPLLQAMNRATFGGKDLLTVGETWGATPEIAKLYSAPERNELSMVFQFEHITATWKDGDKWQPVPLDVAALKQVLFKWQQALADSGWNSLFWNNHDLPRAVSKFGHDGQYRTRSAKMLATTLHLMKGTPYIYQGEEIAMTNVAFPSIDDYQDIETRNFYDLRVAEGVDSDTMMEAVYQNSRDNARTPMQWENAPQAGFTQGTPWLPVNPNYTTINVARATENSGSVLYHYRELIKLRKQYPVIVHGQFAPVAEDHSDVIAYERFDDTHRVLVVSNFSEQKQAITLPDHWRDKPLTCLSYNMDPVKQLSTTYKLAPYESFTVMQ